MGSGEGRASIAHLDQPECEKSKVCPNHLNFHVTHCYDDKVISTRPLTNHMCYKEEVFFVLFIGIHKFDLSHLLL